MEFEPILACSLDQLRHVAPTTEARGRALDPRLEGATGELNRHGVSGLTRRLEHHPHGRRLQEFFLRL